MKTLFLLRHAKSSWKDSSLKDFDRPLNKRGEKDIKLVGKFIRTKKVTPSLIVCSTAERARQTAELFMKSSGLKFELRFDERIYEAYVERLLEVISQLEEAYDAVMLVGHNPGMEGLHASLTGTSPSFSTSTLACVELSVEKWSKVRIGVGQSKWLISPKDLEED
jgi:phosphohistidine phosphatase